MRGLSVGANAVVTVAAMATMAAMSTIERAEDMIAEASVLVCVGVGFSFCKNRHGNGNAKR